MNTNSLSVPQPLQTEKSDSLNPRGSVNVLYMGLPAYHPLAIGQGFDPRHVDTGVQQDTRDMINAGYNVYIMWAGPEISMNDIARKMREIGVQWHIIGLGIGVRASTIPAVVHFLEDLINLFHEEAPTARLVFNSGPGSCLASVEYRIPLGNEPDGRPGNLLGYDVVFDGDAGLPFQLNH